jgi:hypothetical protein
MPAFSDILIESFKKNVVWLKSPFALEGFSG